MRVKCRASRLSHLEQLLRAEGLNFQDIVVFGELLNLLRLLAAFGAAVVDNVLHELQQCLCDAYIGLFQGGVPEAGDS